MVVNQTYVDEINSLYYRAIQCIGINVAFMMMGRDLAFMNVYNDSSVCFNIGRSLNGYKYDYHLISDNVLIRFKKILKDLICKYVCADTNIVPDPIPDHVLDEVTIGTQTWKIKNVSDNILGSLAYNNNDENVPVYGRMYSISHLNAIEALHPGWHIPSLAEWTELINYCGGRNLAGGVLKEIGTEHWNAPNTAAVDTYGFSAVPAGIAVSSSNYLYFGESAFMLTSTEYDQYYMHGIGFYNITGIIVYERIGKTFYSSVRLIKD